MQNKEKKIYPVITVRAAKEGVFFGPGVIMTMEALDATGAMKEACKITGISYSKSWRILNEAERQLGCSIISRRHGGSSGGGCVITPKGRKIMDDYREAERRIKKYAEQVFGEVFSSYHDLKNCNHAVAKLQYNESAEDG